MEVLAQLSWVDLVIIVALVGGVFAGFTQGMIRYVLNALAVILAFVLASQLKGPILDLLGFWQAFTPEGRELLIFVLLFFGFVIAGFFVIRALYHRTRLPIVKQLDEIGGAIFGAHLRGDGDHLPAAGVRQLLRGGRPDRRVGGRATTTRSTTRVIVAVLPRDDHPDRRLPGAPVRPGRDRRPPRPVISAPAIGPATARTWFDRPSDELARDLLGARLVHASAGRGRRRPDRRGGGVLRARRTSPRTRPAGGPPATRVMFGPPGHLYVYLVYGLHHCLNVVAGPGDKPEAVLIRALAHRRGDRPGSRPPRDRPPETRLASGPGNVGQALGVDRSLNGADLLTGPVRVEPRAGPTPSIRQRAARRRRVRGSVGGTPDALLDRR